MPLPEYRAGLEALADRLLAAGANVVLLPPTVIEENPQSEGNRRLAGYRAAMRDVGRARGVPVAPTDTDFDRALAAGKSADPGYSLTTDGVHMRPAGDAVMALAVLKTLNFFPDGPVKTRNNGPSETAIYDHGRRGLDRERVLGRAKSGQSPLVRGESRGRGGEDRPQVRLPPRDPYLPHRRAGAPLRDWVARDWDGDREAAVDHHLGTIYRRVYDFIERGHSRPARSQETTPFCR